MVQGRDSTVPVLVATVNIGFSFVLWMLEHLAYPSFSLKILYHDVHSGI